MIYRSDYLSRCATIGFIFMKNSPSTLPSNLVRLEKHIASLGLASRREAKDLIIRGLVSVNSKKIINPGHAIDAAKDKIIIAPDSKNSKEYILLYKPRGMETNKTNPKLKDIHDIFPEYKHLAPIGRLDADSEGLIILSNDGILTKALTKPGSTIGKTYLVTVQERINPRGLRRLAEGIVLDGVKTKPAVTRRTSDYSFTIVLHEGRKHQIRRMSDAVNWTVTSLVRVGIGHLELGHMKPRETRKINQKDISLLKI